MFSALLGLICPIGKVHKESNCLQLNIKFPFIWPCLPLEVSSDQNIGDNTVLVSVMTFWGKEDPAANEEEEEEQEEQERGRGSSEADDIELEEDNPSRQFPPTSLKILHLNNPLRRQCINIFLSP